MFSVSYREEYNHCVGESNYHLQFTPKYRRRIFQDQVIREACARTMRDIAESLGVKLHAVEFGPDHCHLFVGNCRRHSASELAQRFKGASSRTLRQKQWNKLHGNALWSNGYFYESVGRITSGKIKYYIERQQGKHWTNQKHETQTTPKKQYSLDEFN